MSPPGLRGRLPRPARARRSGASFSSSLQRRAGRRKTALLGSSGSGGAACCLLPAAVPGLCWRSWAPLLWAAAARQGGAGLPAAAGAGAAGAARQGGAVLPAAAGAGAAGAAREGGAVLPAAAGAGAAGPSGWVLSPSRRRAPLSSRRWMASGFRRWPLVFPGMRGPDPTRYHEEVFCRKGLRTQHAACYCCCLLLHIPDTTSV